MLFRSAFSKDGYTSSSQCLDAITVDSTHSIVLPKIYTITFNIKDTNGIALKNVSVTVGTTTKAADASGVVSFVVSKGTYAYSAVYYDSTKTGSVSVTVSDVVTNISFERDVADSQPVLNGNI